MPQRIDVEVSANDGASGKGSRRLATTTLELTANGQEKTALRFKLDAAGKLVPDSLSSIFKPLRNAE